MSRLSDAELERYLRIVRAEIRKMAPAAVRHFGQIGYDFTDDAYGHIWEKLSQGRFDPRKGDFAPWCRTVLRNLFRDVARRARRRAKTASTSDVPEAGTENASLHQLADQELEEFSTSPFSAAEMREIRQWPAKDRVTLLWLSGLWRKVPVSVWERWARDLHHRPIQRWLSPPPELLAAEEPDERLPLVAEALGEKRNTVSQRWCRKKALLRRLDSVRSLESACMA